MTRVATVGPALFAVCGFSLLGIGTFTSLGYPRSHNGPAEAGHYASPATLAQ